MEYLLELKRLNIEPVLTRDGTLAWHIADVPAILECLSTHDLVVLGGDILDVDMNHTYDSWFYNIDKSLSSYQNIKYSSHAAQKYIQKYIECNGELYFVVIVIHKGQLDIYA